MNASINENLQNAAQNYSGKVSHPLNNAFIAGANWQREQDQETIEVAAINMINWLNSHHFDYCGLIERSLALEALEGMYHN